MYIQWKITIYLVLMDESFMNLYVYEFTSSSCINSCHDLHILYMSSYNIICEFGPSVSAIISPTILNRIFWNQSYRGNVRNLRPNPFEVIVAAA